MMKNYTKDKRKKYWQRRTFIDKTCSPFQFSIIIIEEVRVREHHKKMVRRSVGIQAELIG